MHLVNYLVLEFPFARRVTDVVPQLAHLLDAVVAGAIDLQNVETVAAGNFLAAVADTARSDCRPIHAIQRFRQDPGRRGFADPARPDEQISMREPVLFDRVPERPGDVGLADEIVKSLRPIFAREDLITHGDESNPLRSRAKTQNKARRFADNVFR